MKLKKGTRRYDLEKLKERAFELAEDVLIIEDGNENFEYLKNQYIHCYHLADAGLDKMNKRLKKRS